MNNDLRKLAKLYAKEHELNLQDVLNVIDIPFEFLTHIMKTKCNRKKLHFPSVRIPYWGIYHSPDWMKERIKRKYK
jgi:hypothetical protein